jgi:hypothetical protein
MSPTFAP